MLKSKTFIFSAGSVAILFSLFIFRYSIAQDAETLFHHQIEGEIALANEQYESAIEHVREQIRFYPTGHYETFALYDKIGRIYWKHLDDYPAAVRAYARGRNWITLLDLLEESRKKAEKFVDLLPNAPKGAASNQSSAKDKALSDPPGEAAFRKAILEAVPGLCEEDVQPFSCGRFFWGNDERPRKARLQQALGCYEEAARAFSEIYAEDMTNHHVYFQKRINEIYAKYPALAAVSPFEHPETLKALRREHPEDADLGEMEAFLNLVLGVLEEVKQDKTKHLQRTHLKRFESFYKSYPESEWLVLGPHWANAWQRSSGRPWVGKKLLTGMPYWVYEHSKNTFFRAMVKPRQGRNAISCDEECERVVQPYLQQIPADEIRNAVFIVSNLDCPGFDSLLCKLERIYETDGGALDALPSSEAKRDILYFYLKDFLKATKGYGYGHPSSLVRKTSRPLPTIDSLQKISTPARRLWEGEKLGREAFFELEAYPDRGRGTQKLLERGQLARFYTQRQFLDYVLRICRRMFQDFPEVPKREDILHHIVEAVAYHSPDEERLLGIVAWLEKEFPDYPMPATLFFAIAELYRGEERYKEALAYYLKAADAPAESGEAARHFLYVGSTYAYLGEWEEALTWWEKAARHPCSDTAYHYTQQDAAKKLAEYYRSQGEYRKAFEASAPVSLAGEDCTGALGGQRMDRIARLFDDWTRFEDPETVVSLLERRLASLQRGTWWRVPLRVGEIYRRLGWLERLRKFIAEHASKDTEPDIGELSPFATLAGELSLFAALEKYLALVEQHGNASLKDVVAELQQASKPLKEKRGLSAEDQFKVGFLYQELKRFKPEKRARLIQSLLEEAPPPPPPAELLRALAETEHPEALCYLAEKSVATRDPAYLGVLSVLPPFVKLPCMETVLTEAQKDDPAFRQIRARLRGHLKRMWGR
ncbi:MAG: tetratricopeptide repeat protein [Acidobacteriota bacterium]|nr:MAG: tetratricopeptide repeat protein [Acidobacteriota bacterium]